MHERALFRRFPELHNRLPWLKLAELPTRVEPFNRQLQPNLWIKRDDATARPYGGNKVRKLEFLLAAARAKKARRLITVGAAGSHHALATTVYGRALGFDVTLVLFPQPLTDHVRHILLLDQAYGAELRYTSRMELVPAALFATSLRYRREHPFVIPAGGSDAVGTLGYIDAALELAEQIQHRELPEPEYVVVAAGTLGTAAGLALGFEIAGLRTGVQAIRITSRLVTNERALARLVRGAEVVLARHGVALKAAERALGRVQIVHGHIGEGYGKETAEAVRASAIFHGCGIQLDPTYTAKAAAGFLAGLKDEQKPVLFWQTLSAAEPAPPAGLPAISDLPSGFQTYLSQ